MWKTWVQSLVWEDSLEKEKATHSSILAWRIPWTSPWSHQESDTTERLSLHFISFAVQKLASLISSLWFVFAFISIALEHWLKKTLVQFMSENVSPMLSSSHFIVLWLVFKSLSNFEFIFVHDIKLYSNLIDLDAAVQLSQHHLLKRLFFFFSFYILASFIEDSWTVGMCIFGLSIMLH